MMITLLNRIYYLFASRTIYTVFRIDKDCYTTQGTVCNCHVVNYPSHWPLKTSALNLRELKTSPLEGIQMITKLKHIDERGTHNYLQSGYGSPMNLVEINAHRQNFAFISFKNFNHVVC